MALPTAAYAAILIIWTVAISASSAPLSVCSVTPQGTALTALSRCMSLLPTPASSAPTPASPATHPLTVSLVSPTTIFHLLALAATAQLGVSPAILPPTVLHVTSATTYSCTPALSAVAIVGSAPPQPASTANPHTLSTMPQTHLLLSAIPALPLCPTVYFAITPTVSTVYPSSIYTMPLFVFSAPPAALLALPPLTVRLVFPHITSPLAHAANV